ncbi:MAG: hypothetical protein WBW69_19600 [Candidatus Korobacteraceae bacterium]
MFKVKDLFIGLPPESCLDPDSPTYNAALPVETPLMGLGGTTLCCGGGWSIYRHIPIPIPITYTPVQDYVVMPLFGGGGYYVSPAMQAPLKEYLRTALEQAAKSGGPSGRATEPQTVAEVEMLEEKLSAALEELRARKAELGKDKK